MNIAFTKEHDRSRIGDSNSESGAKVSKKIGKLTMSEISILENQLHSVSINQDK